jgi:L-methionine (R)-S-oxide reductase
LKTYRSTRDVLAEVERVLATVRPAVGSIAPLEQVVKTLYGGRHYFWIGIYLVIGHKVVRQCFRGPVPPCHSFEFGEGNVGTAGQRGIAKVVPDVSADLAYSMCFVETKSEAVIPIKLVGRVLGVIDAESDQINAFGAEDRILLKRVATALAKFLTGRGKYIVRHAKEAAQAEAPANRAVRSGPQSEKQLAAPAGLRAAAGDKG